MQNRKKGASPVEVVPEPQAGRWPRACVRFHRVSGVASLLPERLPQVPPRLPKRALEPSIHRIHASDEGFVEAS